MLLIKAYAYIGVLLSFTTHHLLQKNDSFCWLKVRFSFFFIQSAIFYFIEVLTWFEVLTNRQKNKLI